MTVYQIEKTNSEDPKTDSSTKADATAAAVETAVSDGATEPKLSKRERKEERKKKAHKAEKKDKHKADVAEEDGASEKRKKKKGKRRAEEDEEEEENVAEVESQPKKKKRKGMMWLFDSHLPKDVVWRVDFTVFGWMSVCAWLFHRSDICLVSFLTASYFSPQPFLSASSCSDRARQVSRSRRSCRPPCWPSG